VKVDAPIPFARRTELNLPLFSARVQAGFPSPADDHLERSIDLNEELIQHPAATFFVRVKGESMHDAGIQSGDILVVDRSLAPTDRKIVVAMIDGEFTVKRFRNQDGRIFLEAANDQFPRIEVSGDQELVVWGVVSFVIHPAR
jgi:DNA polymerase V